MLSADKSFLYRDLSKILLTREEILNRVDELGKQIAKDYEGKNPFMICILKGASPFFTDLIRCIDLQLSIDFMSISSYGSSTKSSGEVRVLKDLDKSIANRDVIVVEDIIDSGLTLSYLSSNLRSRGLSSLKICTLLDKPPRRVVDLVPDYRGFIIPDEFVVGYGLDYDEKYRNLPDIGILKPEVYSH